MMNLTDAIKDWYKRDVITYKIDRIADEPPTPTVNPDRLNYIWYDRSSGEIWICIDNTPNKNIWKSTTGDIIAPKTVFTVDIFHDGSALGLWTFDGHLHDLSGQYDGVAMKNKTTPGTAEYDVGKFGQCVKSHYSYYQVMITIPGLSSLQEVTVSFWAKWNGWCCTMPFGFKSYDLYTCCDNFGFNTGHGDIYGIDNFSQYKNQWIHIVALFKQGAYGELWINGEKQIMSLRRGRDYGSTAQITDTFYVFGWGNNTSYRNFGCVDQLRIFNRALTDDEINILYHEVG